MGAEESRLNLLAVDPGLNATGWARFERGTLVACGLLTASHTETVANRARRMHSGLAGVVAHASPLLLLVEKPQVYPQRKQRGDPNDLIALAVVAGALLTSMPNTDVALISPRQWKGTIPKERKLTDYLVHTRILKVLCAGERRVYDYALAQHPESLRHNIADAVGIGLWALPPSVRGD
jgi:hypothetical protein